MRRRTFYVLECAAEGCVAEFLLNDQPVVRRGEGLGGLFTGQCNHELIPGENEVTVLISPGPTPASALRARREVAGRERRGSVLAGEEPKPARVSCRLVRYLEREVIGSPAGVALLELEWEDMGSGAPRHWPQVVSGVVDVGEAFGRWAWQDAPAIEWSEATEAEVRAFLEEMHAALAAKDLDAFVRRSRVRLAEISRAYQLPSGQKEREVRENARFYMEQPEWGLQPLPWRREAPRRATAALRGGGDGLADLRVCARRRQIDCVARDGESLLRELPRGEYGLVNKWPMRLARIEGELHVVR
ncbi:MAG: hypothetical protein AB7N76_03560 [Planctomycetota bacterium]